VERVIVRYLNVSVIRGAEYFIPQVVTAEECFVGLLSTRRQQERIRSQIFGADGANFSDTVCQRENRELVPFSHAGFSHNDLLSNPLGNSKY
jgi:hypothetical protein